MRLQAEQQAKVEFERQLESLEQDRARTLEERKRGEALKAAYNADRKAMTDRIADLEISLKQIDTQRDELQQRLSQTVESDQQQRNEVNFWNSKVTMMRRDIDY